MEERFQYIPLTLDNILSFEDYIPRTIQTMILLDNVFGWGVVEGDVVSGAAMVELVRDTAIVTPLSDEDKDQLRILWLYVDEAVRGEGIGRELLDRCRALAEEKDVMGLTCRYPVDGFGGSDDFLVSCGFSVASDDREEMVEVLSDSALDPKQPIHTAWLRLKGKAQNADRALLERFPEMGLVMPRLAAISLFLADMGYGSLQYVEDDRGKVMLAVPREGELCDIMLSVLPDEHGDAERYTIVARGRRPYNEKTEVTANYLERWQQSHLMTIGEIDEDESCIEFIAMILVEAGAVDEERFRDFFTAVCEEIDSFE